MPGESSLPCSPWLVREAHLQCKLAMNGQVTVPGRLAGLIFSLFWKGNGMNITTDVPTANALPAPH